MVALWCVLGLIVSAISVSALGAAFSVYGLSLLFSGAAVAVIAMASSLEFAKFTLVAYLHQRWRFLGRVFKYYLLVAVIALSLITSMGIFGFLSDAYQSASNVLDTESLKLETLETQQNHINGEIARINRGIEEIPVTRISKKLKARQESEPAIAALTREGEQLAQQVAQSKLQVLTVQHKVGPLIYISRAFNIPVDQVVKYLVLLLVCVFDPLAICLVIATSEALESRRSGAGHPKVPSHAVPHGGESLEVSHVVRHL